MNICVIGAGAIGGLLGIKLALSGHNVQFVDQGSHLVAIKKKGLKLVMSDGTRFVLERAQATDDFARLGIQDVVILAVKAHHIHQVADKIPALLGPYTSLVTVQNGMPWWYFQKHGGKYEGYSLQSVDPGDVIRKNINADHVIGCVAYPASSISEPGVIRHVEGNRFAVGELDGTESARSVQLVQAINGAGFKARQISDIRAELWLKALGTLSFNPISGLTHATMVDICRFQETRQLAAEMMMEAQEIAVKLGIQFRHTIERRIVGAERVGRHKTSLLQDVEAGRSLELEALMGSIIEMGHLTNTPAPLISAVYACIKLLNKTYRDANARINMTPLL